MNLKFAASPHIRRYKPMYSNFLCWTSCWIVGNLQVENSPKYVIWDEDRERKEHNIYSWYTNGLIPARVKERNSVSPLILRWLRRKNISSEQFLENINIKLTFLLFQIWKLTKGYFCGPDICTIFYNSWKVFSSLLSEHDHSTKCKIGTYANISSKSRVAQKVKTRVLITF